MSLTTEIKNVGQRFVDLPVSKVVSLPSQIANEVATAFGHKPTAAITTISHYERTLLRWMKPDNKGGLVPRDATSRE